MNLATRPQSGNTERERERIRFQLCRYWRSIGKTWFDDELERAVNERLKPTATLPLFDTGEAAKESRANAFRQSERAAGDRRYAALGVFREAGTAGATRAEVSERLHCQQSSICRTVLELIQSGELVELPQKRTSQFGGAGSVVILREFAGVRHCG